jgi:predicted NBD/HSP70 family sugar kinase
VVRVRTGLDQAAVLLENEVNLAAIAEHLLLAGQGIDTFALLWLGAGVGAALVLDGRLRRGASGGAGEIGYLPVAVTGTHGPLGPIRLLDCGAGGLVGVGGLAGAGALAELAGQVPPEQWLPAVADRVVFGVAAFAVTLDPGVVVLGGENGAAGGVELAGLVERRLAQICPVPARVLPTAVPGNPILAGAVATALDRARADLWP